MEPGSLVIISILVFLVAVLYSSVGHGGASGYLAILSLFAVAPATMGSTALMLNVLVAGVALVAYTRAGHLSWRLAWPFLALSIPAAFLGGFIHISDKAYFVLLALALLVAAFRLAMKASVKDETTEFVKVSLPVSLGVGAGIGFLSGIVGVGGGIFLSPIMIILKWANTKRTSAVAALFIVVNSIAGLAGRFFKGNSVGSEFLPLIAVAFLGGLLGSYFGANRFSGILLRRILSVVLLIAATKLVLALF
jgi:uncharacterized membrane protein YfcA